jgi:NAD(P)-dependent dehydrogenase (short-subunit alcohol dehydrogenase family)
MTMATSRNPRAPQASARREEAVRSIERRTCVVTGATAGIGRAIARGLASRGAHVVLACRDRERGLEAAHEIAWSTGSPADIVLVDLADTRAIDRAADELGERFDRIDVLVNNAGVWSVDRVETAQGIERTWAVNVLAYYRMTARLAPLLAGGRVVNVASGLAHSLDLDDVQFHERRYRGVTAYAQSKQADRMLTRWFARALASAGTTVSSMHPGFTRTNAFRDGGGVQGRIAGLGALLFGKSPARAADTAIWLALDREVAGLSGGYFQDRCELACPYADVEQEDALAALCEEMCGAV